MFKQGVAILVLYCVVDFFVSLFRVVYYRKDKTSKKFTYSVHSIYLDVVCILSLIAGFNFAISP